MKSLQPVNLRSLRRQAGLAILDILVWAGGIILAIAIIGGLAFLVTGSGTSVNYATGLAAIKKCSVDVMYGNADKSAISTTIMLNSQCVPPSWVSGTSIVSPEGGTVTIASANVAGGTNNGFSMTVADVSEEACTGMLPGMAPAFYTIVVDTTTVKAATATATDPSALTTACTTSPPVNVIFTYVQ